MLGSTDRWTGDYTPLPERYQAAFRFGIRFIELRFPRPTENARPIFGPLDIRVDEDLEEGSMKVRYHTKVLSGVEAQIRYDVMNNKGLAIAWLFDDKSWMNRVYLMDNEWLYKGIFAMHTRDGVVPGSVIKLEIDAFRDVLTEEKPIWKVMMPNGNEAGFYWNEREAKVELSQARIDKGWYIEQGRKRDKKKDVLDIIRQYRTLVDGWTSAPVFQEKYVSQAKILIEERKRKMIPDGDVRSAPEDMQTVIKQTLLSMDPAVLRRIADDLDTKKAVSDSQATEALTVPEKADAAFVFTRSGLNTKTVEELRAIALRIGIARPERIRKEQLIERIIEMQTGGGAESASPVEEPINETDEVIAQ